MIYSRRMLSPQMLLDRIGSSKNALKDYGVKRIGVFGSVAREEATEGSDIDVLVEFDLGKKTYRNFYGTATLIESLFKRHVDLVTAEALSPYLKPHVLKDVQYVQISG